MQRYHADVLQFHSASPGGLDVSVVCTSVATPFQPASPGGLDVRVVMVFVLPTYGFQPASPGGLDVAEASR